MAKKTKPRFVPMTADNEQRINASTNQKPPSKKSKSLKKRADEILASEDGESSSINTEVAKASECGEAPTDASFVATISEKQKNIPSIAGTNAVMNMKQQNVASLPTNRPEGVCGLKKPILPDSRCQNVGWVKLTRPLTTLKPFGNKQNLNANAPEFEPKVSADVQDVPTASQDVSTTCREAGEIENLSKSLESETFSFKKGEVTENQLRSWGPKFKEPSISENKNSEVSFDDSARSETEWNVERNRPDHSRGNFRRNDRGNHQRSNDPQRRNSNQQHWNENNYPKNDRNKDNRTYYQDRNGPNRSQRPNPNFSQGGHSREFQNGNDGQQRFNRNKGNRNSQGPFENMPSNDARHSNSWRRRDENNSHRGGQNYNNKRSGKNYNYSHDRSQNNSQYESNKGQRDGQEEVSTTTCLVDESWDEPVQLVQVETTSASISFDSSAYESVPDTSTPSVNESSLDWNDLNDAQDLDGQQTTSDHENDLWNTPEPRHKKTKEVKKVDNWRDKPAKFKDPRMERDQLNSSSVTVNRRSYLNDRENTDKEFREWDRTWEKVQEFKNVTEVQQDLFMMPKEYSLAHCVAEDMRMGSGIAVQFKRDFKSQADLLQQKAKQGGLAVLEHEGRYIYYLVTKRVSTGKPTYYTLWQSLKKLRDHTVEHEVSKLAVPRLGCGLDRLEWAQVKSMIQYLFDGTKVEITVCNFQQNEEMSPLTKTYTSCRQKHETYPITKIENGTIIIYFSTEKGDVTEEMRALDKKFNFLPKFNQFKSKSLGTVVVFEDLKAHYTLCGCIVRKTSQDCIDYSKLGKCASEINKYNRKAGFNYVALQSVSNDDYHDDLASEKILTILTNYLRNVDVYVCSGELSEGLEE